MKHFASFDEKLPRVTFWTIWHFQERTPYGVFVPDVP
jgi:hypothetical protein